MPTRYSLVGPIPKGSAVSPTKGVPLQPRYTRSAATWAISPRLRGFRSCIAGELAGLKHPSRMAVRAAFTSAAKKCKP